MYMLMRRCWEYEAKRRPSISDICAVLSGNKTLDDLEGVISIFQVKKRGGGS
ncbi:hypothetical protein E6Q11_05955 [Candidatus Dojkabacteria bacterium]|uniref:Serine-threonine/tyrosine-protein kinase catalytic domain-containing protein n=1 Tax=Candidatus Dojkabacteria bacterium TaxID=2099670 RepID=A0A5C7J317_9BACT|nr:MAG: hypothetical protein E6Q11_05955 [Candidatus Dojkabacteria bacterium]